jgi:hypothetical protein
MQVPSVHTLLSWNSSVVTGPVVFIGDARALSISLTTTTNASTYTVQASNWYSQTSAGIPEGQWSTLTALTAQGIYAVQVGAMQIRALQAASTSSATMLLAKLMAD